MRQDMSATFLAGIAGAGLFLGAFALQLGFVFLYFSALPFFLIGLSRGFQPLLAAIGLATLMVAGAASPIWALFFILYFGVPVLLIAPRALVCAADGWQKLGPLLADVALYAGFMAMYGEWRTQAQGGLAGVLGLMFEQKIIAADARLYEKFLASPARVTALMLGLTAWYWLMLLFAQAVAAQRWLAARGRNVRPQLMLEPFALPGWMLALPAGASVWLLLAPQALLPQCLLMIFLLPYYLLGASFAARSIRDAPSGAVWVFLLYAFSLLIPALALALAASGLWRQVRALKTGSA